MFLLKILTITINVNEEKKKRIYFVYICAFVCLCMITNRFSDLGNNQQQTSYCFSTQYTQTSHCSVGDFFFIWVVFSSHHILIALLVANELCEVHVKKKKKIAQWIWFCFAMMQYAIPSTPYDVLSVACDAHAHKRFHAKCN